MVKPGTTCGVSELAVQETWLEFQDERGVCITDKSHWRSCSSSVSISDTVGLKNIELATDCVICLQ